MKRDIELPSDTIPNLVPPHEPVAVELFPPVDETPSRRRVLAVVVLLTAWIVYCALESLLWRRQLWGAHFLAYLPPAWWLALPVALAAMVLLATRPPPRPPTLGRAARFAPYLTAVGAAGLFWIFRVRHLFWGDGLPLSISVPQGQAFHPDEPLAMYLDHLLYRLGGGHWSGATAVAVGSVVAGALFTGRTVQWFGRRGVDRGTASLAALCLLTQGFILIFFGYVENYAYLAVALLFFLTWGVDFLEGRIGLARPLAASLIASALHVLGWLTMICALFLVIVGLADPRRRVRTALVSAVMIVVGFGVARYAAVLYGAGSPVDRFVGAVQKLLTPVLSSSVENLGLARRLGDIWSQVTIVGPLSSVGLVALLLLLRGGPWVRTASGAFLVLATAVFTIPLFFIGGWGIGPARDWDIFAARAVVPALCALTLIMQHASGAARRTILLAIVVASLFHTAPWIALNTSLDRCMNRVADLPLGKGRSPMMLGTYFLNSGDLRKAEEWFRRSLAEDSLNVNSQSGLGLTLARQGRLTEALGPMSLAVEMSPTKVQFHNDLIALLFALGRWSDAVEEIEKLLRIDPKNRAAWLGLFDVQVRLGRLNEAAATARSGLAHLPGDPELFQALKQVQAMSSPRSNQAP